MRSRKLALIMGVLVLAMNPFESVAAESKFSEIVTKDGLQLELQGTGHKRFLFMRAFDAGFYTTERVAEDKLLTDVPKYLEVEYHLGIPAKSLSDFTVSYMKLNVSPDEFRQLQQEIELMRKYFVDLRPNDRFSLTYLPEVGTQFSHNGKLTGTIAGEKFGRALFSVWIGKKPFDPALKQKILGLEKSGEIMTPIRSTHILWLKAFFGLLSLSMIGLVILTSLKSNMFQLPPEVVNEPWFRTTLVDFYFNICVISAWTIYKEASVWRSVVWIIAFVLLGSIATCFYVFLQLCQWRPGDGLEKVLLPKRSSS